MAYTSSVLVELEQRKQTAASAPRDAEEAESALWEAAARLPAWFIVNRGTEEQPVPSGFAYDASTRLLGVYSSAERTARRHAHGGSGHRSTSASCDARLCRCADG